MSTARKPGLVRRLSIGAALLGVTAAPFALAMPAEAATTLQGCTVNPLAPVYAGRNAARRQAGPPQRRHRPARRAGRSRCSR